MSDRWAIQRHNGRRGDYYIKATDGTVIAEHLSLVHAQLIAQAPALLDAVRDFSAPFAATVELGGPDSGDRECAYCGEEIRTGEDDDGNTTEEELGHAVDCPVILAREMLKQGGL